MKSIYLTISIGIILLMFQSCGQQPKSKEKPLVETPVEHNSTQHFYNLISEAFLVEDTRGAIRHCNALIAMDSTNARAYYFRGDAKLYEGNYKEALPDFDKAIAFDPTNAQAYYFRGYCYLGLARYQLALPDFNKTIELKADHIRALIDRGTCYALMGDKEKGCDELTKAAEIAVKIDKRRANKALKKYCQ